MDSLPKVAVSRAPAWYEGDMKAPEASGATGPQGPDGSREANER